MYTNCCKTSFQLVFFFKEAGVDPDILERGDLSPQKFRGWGGGTGICVPKTFFQSVFPIECNYGFNLLLGKISNYLT